MNLSHFFAFREFFRSKINLFVKVKAYFCPVELSLKQNLYV